MQHARAQFQHLILHSRLSQAYSGLKTLYLESNAIADIEGLEALTNLRCLYLGRNMVHEIAGLDSLTQLESLDLSDNDIRCIDGLTSLTRLKFLSLSGQSSFFSVSSAPYCMVVLHQVKCQSLVTGCSDITAHDSTFWSSVKELQTVRQDIQQRSLTMLMMLVHLQSTQHHKSKSQWQWQRSQQHTKQCASTTCLLQTAPQKRISHAIGQNCLYNDRQCPTNLVAVFFVLPSTHLTSRQQA